MNASSKADDRSLVERLLRVVTEVRAGEGVTALILTLAVFLLLTAYYVIKPVREGLILEMASGAEYKSYMGGAIAVALLGAVPAYSRVARKSPGNRLVIGVTLFFASHLLLFYLASLFEAIRGSLGLVFYLWVGVFNMMVVAQFWAFANDVYTEEQGKRLFALVGVGASTGAVVGSGVATVLPRLLGVYQMLLVSAGILVLFAALIQAVHVRESGRAQMTDKPDRTGAAPEDQDRKRGAFGMVFKNRYLILLAAFHLVFSLVNTNGEYMLSKLFKAAASEAVALHVLSAEKVGAYLVTQYGMFYSWVNALGVLLQIFVVSRLVRYGGLRLAFLVLPCIALLDAAAVAALPVLFVLRIGKVAENAVDYSVNNTVRHMLWLPTTREMKYRAKQAVDTFFVRMGDVSSALLVYVSVTFLAWEVRAFAVANLLLVAVWLWLALAILRENRKLSRQAG
jgi:AAA family ATP:ADP antiporter